MILYFANRTMDILGHASTNLPEGFVIIEDLKSEEVETGVATFTCKVGFDKKSRGRLEAMMESGNYILRKNDRENEFYTIIDTEIDTKNQEIYVYAEDAGLDLLNEIAEAYEATEAHAAEWYVKKWIIDSGFEIGINEIPASTVRTLKWEGESTVTERLASIATQFGGFEVSYSYDIKGTTITNKYVNIYAQRGKDNGAQLRLNYEIDRIVIKKSVANIATAFKCTGGMPENAEEPITLKGYEYDDGDFYVDENGVLCSRNAVSKWSRYVWNKEPNKLDGYHGHIMRQYSYDTTDQATLCSHAITELKKICDMEVNYEVDIAKLPENIKIGDRIDIIDDTGKLYLSSRILLLETSVTENTKKATIGEHLIKEGGISATVAELATQFAEIAKETQAATIIAEAARKTAETSAQTAQAQAETAAAAAAQAQADAADAKALVEVAQTKAESAVTQAGEAKTAADEAAQNASEAKTTAEAAKIDAAKAVEDVAALGGQLETIEQTMTADYARKNELTETEAKLQTQISQNAAEISSTASKLVTVDETANSAAAQAATAQSTADTAQSKADAAAADAITAQAAATAAQNAADAAQADADAAKTAANNAQTVADKAEEDLAAAKADLEAVTSRVDATEEDIAAAEAAVVKAQNAADTAKAEAQTAANAAAEADEAAKTAQNTADNAKTAADTAQAAAKSAQDAADAAQSTVDSLAVRVTSAETKITQNSEQVALMATKEEVATTLGGYYTKSQTDAAITVKANEITSAVSQTYTTKEDFNNLEIGGRNYALQTANPVTLIGLNQSNQCPKLYNTSVDFTELIGKEVMLSFDYEYSDDAVRADSETAYGCIVGMSAAPWNRWVRLPNPAISKSGRIYGSVTIPSTTSSSTSIGTRMDYLTGTLTISNLKFEIGNKVTDWTPAPEDVDSDIENVNTKYSSLEQTVDGFQTTVANTYATKSALATTDSKAASAATAAENAQKDIDNLEVGGRNLLANSNVVHERTNASTNTNGIYLFVVDGYDLQSLIGKALTLSYLQHSPGNRDDSLSSNSTIKYRYGMHGCLRWDDSTGANAQKIVYPFTKYLTTTNDNKRVEETYVFTAPDGYDTLTSVSISIQLYARPASDNDNKWLLGYPKLEVGNRATDWTPAPEDMATEAEVTELSTRVTQTENSITSQASSIDSLGTRMSTVEQTAEGLTVSLEETNAEIENLSVGGRNLVAGTDLTTVYSGAKDASGSYKDVWKGKTIDIPTGTEYVLSFEAKADVNQTIQCFFYSPNTTTSSKGSTGYSGTSGDGCCNVSITTEWKRYWVKWTQTPATAVKTVIVGRNLYENIAYVRAIKLEEGNKATSWTPAPEDVAGDISAAQSAADSAASAAANAQSTANTAKTSAATAQSTADTARAEAANAAKTATNYLNFGTPGLVIGNMTESTLGKNVLIDSESVNIRSGSTILASFGEDLIELGKNSNNATISLCGGNGIISFESASYDSTFDALKIKSESCIELDSGYLISLFSQKDDLKSHLIVSPYRVEAGGYYVELYGSTGIYLHSTGGLIDLYSVDSISITTEDSIVFNAPNGLILKNNQCLYSADANGVNREIMRLNNSTSAPTLILGDGLYNASIGAVNISAGSTVRLLTANERVILESVSSTTNTAYFRPQNDAKCSLGTASKRWYAVYASNSTVQTSDRREKENIMPIGNDLITILSEDGESETVNLHSALFDRLQPVQYNFINGNKKKCYGLIAQDVIEVMRELEIGENELDLVHHEFWNDEEAGEVKESFGIAYTNLIALLIHEVQKLKTEVAALKVA